MKNEELPARARDQLVFFEAAQNTAGGFLGEPRHIRQILMCEPNGNSDAVGFVDARSLGQIHQYRCDALFCSMEGESLSTVL